MSSVEMRRFSFGRGVHIVDAVHAAAMLAIETVIVPRTSG